MQTSGVNTRAVAAQTVVLETQASCVKPIAGTRLVSRGGH